MRIPWTKVVTVLLAGLVVAIIAAVPIFHQRMSYEQHKRFRVVTDGRVYRSGQMTADGFRDVIRQYGIKTVVNLQDDEEHTTEDERDPHIPKNPLDKRRKDLMERESEVVIASGGRYIQFNGNALNDDGTGGRPKLQDDFLTVMDDEANYPVLYHCKAGLHRTGWITSVYRMEYEGWGRERALDELRANGFGAYKSTDANDYIKRYIFEYQPGVRADGYQWPAAPAVGAPKTGGRLP
jgi:tyrosine-protein phosphatase SIW14